MHYNTSCTITRLCFTTNFLKFILVTYPSTKVSCCISGPHLFLANCTQGIDFKLADVLHIHFSTLLNFYFTNLKSMSWVQSAGNRWGAGNTAAYLNNSASLGSQRVKKKNSCLVMPWEFIILENGSVKF